jgi:hypothetical protein
MANHTCSDTCGCCAGLDRPAPLAIDNRPGLDAIGYRIGRHPEFKASLLASLSSSAHPALQRLRTRDDADFTVALCDALAVMADTLTFYQERVANEAYLRTATEARSIHELAALIGYRPAPGVAASTHLAFKVEESPGAPDRAPQSVMIPAGTRVQSVPAAGEAPVNFETISAIAGRPEWNALRPRLTERHPPVKDSTDLILDGVGHNLGPGDVMLFVGDERESDPGNRQWVTRVLKTVRADAATNRTRVTWEPPIGERFSTRDTRAYVFRQRAAIFGHSAPDWSGQPDSYKATYMGMETPDQLIREDRAEWPLYTIYAPDPDRRNTFGRFVTPRPEDVAKMLDEAVKAALLSQVKDTVGSVVGAVGGVGNAVMQPVQDIATAFNKLFTAAQIAPKALDDVWTATLKPAAEALGNLGTAASGAATTVGSAVTNAFTDFKNALGI